MKRRFICKQVLM